MPLIYQKHIKNKVSFEASVIAIHLFISQYDSDRSIGDINNLELHLLDKLQWNHL